MMSREDRMDMKEVRDMLRGDWAAEMLGIDEPLMKVWAALGL